MKVFRCDKIKCFSNIGGLGCTLLTEPITDHDCPFYKTEEEIDEGRAEAHKRLLAMGRRDLIDQFEYNPQRRGTW